MEKKEKGIEIIVDVQPYTKFCGKDINTGEVLFRTRTLSYAITRAKSLGYKLWEIHKNF